MSMQIYLIHLMDGTVIQIAEDYGLPAEKGLLGKYKKAEPDELMVFGDSGMGFVYIPKNSIVYISTGDVIAG